MFKFRSPGLLQYVTNTTLPHIPEIAGMPILPPVGHKSHKNHLNVKSESWRRLENIYHIDPSGFAQQVVTWTLSHIREVSFRFEDPHTAEKLSLGTRRQDGAPDKLEHPMDTIDRLGAFLDTLPLMSAQRLFHMLYPETLNWKFRLNERHDTDQNIFDYFLWTRASHEDVEPHTALVVAYQPPWVLAEADFLEFVRSTSLPPYVPPGCVYPSELQSRHRVWAKLWDTCVRHNTKWFVITSWNAWAFGGFSDGWCSGFISDIWYLDEHTPNILECITFWIASAMGYEDGYRRRKVPEPVNALRTEVMHPATQAEVPPPVDSESNWKGKSEDAPSSAHLTSWSEPLSHEGLEGYIPPPIERETPVEANFIQAWRESVINGQSEISGMLKNSAIDRKAIAQFCGEWLL